MFTVWTAPDSIRLTVLGLGLVLGGAQAGGCNVAMVLASLLGRDLAAGTRLPAHRAAAPATTTSVSGEKKHGV